MRALVMLKQLYERDCAIIKVLGYSNMMHVWSRAALAQACGG